MSKVYKFVFVIVSMMLLASPSLAGRNEAKSNKTVAFDKWLPLGDSGITGLAPGGSISRSGIPPGRLHALSISLYAPPGADNSCLVEFTFTLFVGEFGDQISKRIISTPVVGGGDSSVTTFSLDAPIEFKFDPTVSVLRYEASVLGNTGAGDVCFFGISSVYETFESPATFLPDPYGPSDD